VKKSYKEFDMLRRLKFGVLFAIAFGLGAGIGASLYSSDPNTLFKSVFGATFWGLIFGLFMGGSSEESEAPEQQTEPREQIQKPKSDFVIFGALRIFRGFSGLLFGLQLLGLLPALSWLSNPAAIDSNMVFMLLIKVVVLLLALGAFIYTKKFVHKLHHNKYGEPHPSLNKPLAL
jgi:uncharacterized membrane protein YfcA